MEHEKKSSIRIKISNLLKGDPKIQQILSKYKDNPEMISDALDFIMGDIVEELSPFKIEPVPPREFLESPYYCGKNPITGEGPATTMYEMLKKDFCAVHDFDSGIREVVLTGCVDVDSIICESDGGLVRLVDRIGQDKDVLVLMDKMETSPTTNSRYSGCMDVHKIVLENGMEVIATPDHKLEACVGGILKWVPCGELNVGDHVKTVGYIPTSGNNVVSGNELVELLDFPLFAQKEIPQKICKTTTHVIRMYLVELFKKYAVYDKHNNFSFILVPTEFFGRQLQLLLLRLRIKTKFLKNNDEFIVKFNGYIDDEIDYCKVVKSEKMKEKCHVGDIGAFNGNRFIANGISVHNSIGYGKSFFMELGLLWNLYVLSCFKAPQKYFGLSLASKLAVMVISITEKQAKKNIYGSVKEMIKVVPYFIENFMFDVKRSTDSLIFPRNIEFFNGTSAQSSTIGLNIYAACLDEANFFKVIQQSKRSQASEGEFNEALTLYNSLLRRQDSRFLKEGRKPGTLYVGSSRVYPNDFTEQRIRLAKEAGDKSTYVLDYNLWKVCRERYSKEEFSVEVGGLNRRSRVLVGDETDVAGDIVRIPMDFYDKFKKDVDNALREIAGIAVYSVQPFFGNSEKIGEMFDHTMQRTFSVDRACLSPKNEYMMVEKVVYHPIPHPTKPRYVGVDLGLKKDKAGLVMGYVESMENVTREFFNDETGEFEKVVERMPKIVIELVLQIYPESEFGEIEFSRIRALIFLLKRIGYRIKYASADGYQSADTQQILRRKGILFDYISMDKTPEPYETLRATIYENRLRCIYHSVLEEELNQLERNYITGKVDHNNHFTKDISDALGQVVYNCHKNSEYADEALLPRTAINDNVVPEENLEEYLKEFDAWARK
jgi:hypothetical protein